MGFLLCLTGTPEKTVIVPSVHRCTPLSFRELVKMQISGLCSYIFWFSWTGVGGFRV